MNRSALSFFLAALVPVALYIPRALAGETNSTPSALDFRYAPSSWQTSICLPDDWQKTLVGKDGALLYDYPGEFSGFGTKIAFGMEGAQWVKQELASPRVPIVRTSKRLGQWEILEEAFAAAPAAAAKTPRNDLLIERVGTTTISQHWAHPAANVDRAFQNVAIGWLAPVQYRFKAQKGTRYVVVFGLCEGHHAEAGKRVLQLQVEGKTRRTVDAVAEKGKDVPALYAIPAEDENQDGWIDLAVTAAEQAQDRNTILNVLWVFQGEAPPIDELLAGHGGKTALAYVECGAELQGGAPRHDVLLAHVRNTSRVTTNISPSLTIQSALPIVPQADRHHITIGSATTLFCTQPFESFHPLGNQVVLKFASSPIAPGQELKLSFGVARGQGDLNLPRTVGDAQALLNQSRRFWEKLNLPYGHIEVPDPGVQSLLDSSIRNIYQAREIKEGLPAFQVGPTCYRGLWVVDGSFLLEAITYLGRTNETRPGVKYLMSFQRPDGGIMLIDGHWKETGIALWAITRHARLTGDTQWLGEVWPHVERGFAYIDVMRALASTNATAPNFGLIPDGFSDGGLADKVPEYTNIYWTLAGMRAAVEAARWLGHAAQADEWQHAYDLFYATFRRAAERDMQADSRGHRFLPIRMAKGNDIPPQKAQWAFLHAIFPGKLFTADDPLVQGNMAMLRSVESEDLVFDTGWLKDGLWTYFGSFYGHAWLWLGDGQKAVRTLYAFGNHASPLLCWREEQKPVGQGGQMVGDMPHNWASAEFIRLTRHCLAIERGSELHLFEGCSPNWTRPGMVTRLQDVLTEFGSVSLDFRVAKDGRTAQLKLSPPKRNPPSRIVLHLDGWSGRSGTMDLPVSKTSSHTIQLGVGAISSSIQ